MSTIYDVAKFAGVSPKTVSRVLNDDSAVGEKTRLKVKAAIESLGYIPNTAARSMRSNKSGLVGLITGAISDFVDGPAVPPGLPELYIVRGVNRVMQASGKTLLIADTGGSPEATEKLIRTFREHRVEGLIYVAYYHRQIDLPFRESNILTVLANCFDTCGTPAFIPDDQAGQYQLTKQIIAAGHTRIAYLTLGMELIATTLRLDGYKQALQECGIQFDPDLVRCADTFEDKTDATMLEAVEHLLRLPSPPTVICCGNDSMALRLYGILRVSGIKIPEDISIAGYDNYLAITEGLFPPLTTVNLPYDEIGQAAARKLLSLIDMESGEGEKVLIDSPVVWRDSILHIEEN